VTACWYCWYLSSPGVSLRVGSIYLRIRTRLTITVFGDFFSPDPKESHSLEFDFNSRTMNRSHDVVLVRFPRLASNRDEGRSRSRTCLARDPFLLPAGEKVAEGPMRGMRALHQPSPTRLRRPTSPKLGKGCLVSRLNTHVGTHVGYLARHGRVHFRLLPSGQSGVSSQSNCLAR
jgi:hypothetical protein